MGAVRGVFQPGSAGKTNRDTALQRACGILKEIMELLDCPQINVYMDGKPLLCRVK
jgi:endonuclease IV